MTVEQDIAVVETDILRLFRSISSLNRRLADLVIDSHPDAHAAAHETTGADEMSVAGLLGLLADPQTAAVHAHTHLSATGKTADDHHTEDHAARHAPGGADAIASIEITVVAGTTYTLLDTDDGKLVYCTNAAGCAVTVPTGLRSTFACLVGQGGAVQVTMTPSSTTLNSPDAELKTRVQFSQLSVATTATNVFLIGGDTAA